MTSEAEVSPAIPKTEIFSKEYTGAKPKATLPLRVLDEEVWLSGSELKTDNSSSDEEKPGLEQNKAKKGARRKIKCTKMNYTNSTKSQFTEIKSKHTEACELQEEVVSSSDDSDFNYEKDVKYRKKQIDLFMKKVTETEEYSLSSNQGNEEKPHLQKIIFLQEEIKKAERKYKVAKKNTDAMVTKMAEYLESMGSLTEPEWMHFIDITKQWIACFRKTQFANALKHDSTVELKKNIQIQKYLLKPKKRYKARKLAKNYSHLKNRKMKNVRAKKTEVQRTNKKSRLDIVLARIETESKESSYNEPYNLTVEEVKRFYEIENKLDSFRSCSSMIPDSDQTNAEERYQKVYSDNFASESLNFHEGKEKNDEHESEKNKINFPIRISSSNNCEDELLDGVCNDSITGYCNSCQEDKLNSEN